MPEPARAPIVPVLPPRVPQVPPNRFTRWLGRTILRLGGWRVVGELPDVAKVVVIAAPHSSNWDGVWGLAAKLAMGLEIRLLGKDSLFRVPVLGGVLTRLGVIPVNRSAAHGVVDQAAALLAESDKMWFGLAPEGTRKPVERWKPGFWRIAKAAGVPVLPAYFHYPDRLIGFGPLFTPGDDLDADLARLRTWYRPWQGKHHGTD
ncbi:lysophospholipid acyltransferase family protein [Lysobacter olei]